MAEERKPPQLLALLKKSQAFAESLLKENEHLHLKLGSLEERVQADGLRNRMEEVQLHSGANSRRFQEIDEELNALANLHVATWQLHSTMRLAEVVSVMVEICVNLVGADEVVIYLHDEASGALVPVSERMPAPAQEAKVGQGPIGEAVAKGKVSITPDRRPCAVIPLRLGDRTLGAVVVHRLLSQKSGLNELDHQLFEVMSEQGSTAIYGAYLAGASSTRLSLEAIRAQF
jgi:hypothetical protein